MERNEIVLEFMKSIAPVMVQQAGAIMERIAAAGGDPSRCKVGDKDILHSYGQSAREWAEAMADEYLKD